MKRLDRCEHFEVNSLLGFKSVWFSAQSQSTRAGANPTKKFRVIDYICKKKYEPVLFFILNHNIFCNDQNNSNLPVND